MRSTTTQRIDGTRAAEYRGTAATPVLNGPEAGMNLRKGTAEDLELLISLRFSYLRDDLGQIAPEMERTVKAQLYRYLPEHLKSGDFQAFLAEEDGRTAACAFLVLWEMPANPSCPSGIRGTVFNVWTDPAFRRRGAATQVMNALIASARESGATLLELSATRQGRPLYEKLGFSFSDNTAMRLTL
jgi:ribosomal protein S18 acetylase RimI-like enzyme